MLRTAPVIVRTSWLFIPKATAPGPGGTGRPRRPGPCGPRGGAGGPAAKSGFSAVVLVRRSVTLWTSKCISPAGPVSDRPAAQDLISLQKQIAEAVLHVGRPVQAGPVTRTAPSTSPRGAVVKLCTTPCVVVENGVAGCCARITAHPPTSRSAPAPAMDNVRFPNQFTTCGIRGNRLICSPPFVVVFRELPPGGPSNRRYAPMVPLRLETVVRSR